MKRYEGLFILNTAAREEGTKELIDKISEEIKAAGAKIETVQKMDKRAFSRVTDKRHNAGFYVNIIFEAQPSLVANLRQRFALKDEVFRALFTEAPTPKEAVEAK